MARVRNSRNVILMSRHRLSRSIESLRSPTIDLNQLVKGKYTRMEFNPLQPLKLSVSFLSFVMSLFAQRPARYRITKRSNKIIGNVPVQARLFLRKMRP